MRRIHWTAESQDADAVVSLLRGYGIAAWAFDTGVVRLDWWKTLAFGGCRVMVADEDAAAAYQLVSAYRKGELALEDSPDDRPRCPACHHSAGEEDPRPRRMIFAAVIAFEMIVPAVSLLAGSCGIATYFILQLALIFPGIAAFAIKSRYRCTDCGHAWRAPPQQSFSEMSRAVEGDRGDPGALTSAIPVPP
jgi:transposase-like protein